ncbi:unnamed protein product [Adineta steineri]|uniref:Transmembrane protein n=2 Tax=Adineta steineri TaxID=433720 RepID=A0A815LVT8_9BILA|nr:unnamed protein product [Adineta steineri]
MVLPQQMPINTKSVSKLWKTAEVFLSNLNLLPSVPPTTDEYQLRNQRISTRLFVSLLIILLTIVFLYISLINITQTVNVKTPSIQEYEQLYNTYSQTLTCECTQISINYENFIQIQYTLHQVCHSDFVAQEWINYLANSPGSSGEFYDAFRVSGTFLFQALSTLCVLVDQTISNRLIEFYSSQYVSASVTPSNLFQLQTNAFISQFISSTTNEFLLSFAMIRKTTQSNALLSGQFTNYRFYVDKNDDLYTRSLWYGACTCSSSATCITQYKVINYPNFTQIFPLPGLYTGCYIIESLLQSSLECFYDQVCIGNILLYLGSSTLINVTALDISLSIQFLKNSTIADVLDQLMVEEWNSSSIYENYYSECQPSGCSYTVTSKNSVIYIATTLIGLVGGLITVMKLMVPMLVKVARKRIYKEVKTETETLVQEPNVSILYKLKDYFLTFNIFPSVPPTTDEYQLRNQHISTRLFIFVLIILFSILLLYISLINITQTVNVKAPSIQQYEQLYNSYSQALTCECTQISINYEKFIQIQYTLHQLCYSDFITQEWTNYLATSYGNNVLNNEDFRVTSTFTFQAMSAFCTLVNQTISNSLTEFYSSQYVSASVTPENVFQLQTKAFISQFILSTTDNFLLSLSMIQDTTQSNTLLSGELNNFEFSFDNYYNDITYYAQQYGNCSCYSSATCITPSPIYDLTKGTLLFTVPGLYTGCYIIESLLQSNLRCFYNQTCINKLQSYFVVSSIMNVTALDISLSTQFLQNSTIADVLNQLMVEEWNSSMVTTNERTRTLHQNPKFFFLNLNLFPSVPPTTNEYQLRNQRISTRLFIALLIMSLAILLLYTSLINITQTVSVKTPSIQEYTQLHNSYSQALTCDCTQISINYEKFIKIQYTLHQICHSDFVTQEWITYVAGSIGGYGSYNDDFRLLGKTIFPTMSAFCTLVNQTISNSLIQFYSTQYVSASVTPENVFELQTKAFISEFVTSTRNEFLLSLVMIRNITQSNALFSGTLTNYDSAQAYGVFVRKPIWYGDCTCYSSATCISQSVIYDLVWYTILFTVPGLYTGCYIIESLLQSNLRCFYNQTCINKLQSYFVVSSIMNVTALDISLSRYISD